jgi:hypothetical protein
MSAPPSEYFLRAMCEEDHTEADAEECEQVIVPRMDESM